MQKVRTERMKQEGMITFFERKDKEDLFLSFALWRNRFYLYTFKFPGNQLQMKKRLLPSGKDMKIQPIYKAERLKKRYPNFRIPC
jgi:hypothetical protein